MARIVNFAQGEFVMLGMYGTFAAQMALGFDPCIAPVLVVPALFALGCAVYWLLLRPLRGEPMMQVFATFGLLMALENVMLAVTRGVGYSVNSALSQISIKVGPLQIGLARVIVLSAATAVTIALGWYLKTSLPGKAIRAIAQDRRAARLMGKNVDRMYMISFGIGTALAGLAGCLLARLHTMSPQIGANLIMPDQGLVLVPEGGHLFPFMTVRENLELGAYARSSRGHIGERLDEVQEIFPILKDRQKQMAGKLSGGERQMCAIARQMSKPRLLLIDEPSVGLSPLMAERVLETVARLALGGGPTVIIVEQRATEVLEIANEAHILDHGHIARSGAARTLLSDPAVQETYMGL